MTQRSLLDSLLGNLSVSGALLDRKGRITEVSEAWRQVARAGRLGLENYGIGADYLKHAAFPDSSSAAILRGLKGLLSDEIDAFSTIYFCETPAVPKWYMLAAFAIRHDPESRVAVFHIDVSGLLQNRSGISASMVGIGPGAVDPVIDKVTRAVRQTIATSLQESAGANRNSRYSRERKVINSLSPHQLSLLGHLAEGLSNSEIARLRKISLGTAKNQTAALLRKLGAANRTQAALIAVKNGLLDGAE